MANTQRRSLRRRLAAVAAGVTVALGAVGFTAVPAQAVDSPVCPAGYTCLWDNNNFETDGSPTSRVLFQQWIGNFGLWNYSGTSINGANSAESAYNNGNYETSYLYTGPNKGGDVYVLQRTWWVKFYAASVFYNNLESGYYASFR